MAANFVDCIAPLSLQQFVLQYLGRGTACFRGHPDRFEWIVTASEIEAVLSRLVVHDGMVQLATDHGNVAYSEYLSDIVTVGTTCRRVNVAALTRHMRAGATFGVFHCESMFPAVDTMRAAIGEALLGHVSALLVVNLVAGRPGPLHWDEPDTLICQIVGHKRWLVFAPVIRNPLPRGDTTRHEVAQQMLIFDELLGPGDVLYVPGGWPHQPLGGDGMSVRVAFSIARATGIDLLRFVVDKVSANDFARSALPLHDTPSECPAYIQRLRQLVTEALADDVTMPYCIAQRLWTEHS